MNFLYNIAIYIASFILKIIAVFNKKIELFLNGRKETFNKLNSSILVNDKTIWLHAASLGEFEQGRPIIENIKTQYPNFKIVLTFFSPSGYEVRKNYAFADVVTYLPLDTRTNAKLFLESVHPEIAIFIKYEFWPNILAELKTRNINTILISGIFRIDQSFFKSYGRWMRKSLKTFDHFFVQNKESKTLLEQINCKKVTINGDTRFDRVYEINKQEKSLNFMEEFIQNKYTLVAGSIWPKDEKLLVNYINKYASDDEKFVLAPHNINLKKINDLKNAINKETVLFSDKEKNNFAQVFIVDTIGILTKVYHYANVAYVGGGFGSGIHNILEPAAFGIPLIIGPEYKKFKEAVDLVELGSCQVVNNKNDLNKHLSFLFADQEKRIHIGKITKKYILKNIGATERIMNYITNNIKS